MKQAQKERGIGEKWAWWPTKAVKSRQSEESLVRSPSSILYPISWMKGAKVVLFALSLVLGSVNREIR